MRIVSLIASATEIVCALGASDQLVGRSHECDYPPQIMHLPVCTEIKLNAKASSREINDQVLRIVSDGLSVYRVKPEMLQQLNPDMIITQTQCEVCAVSEKDVVAAVCQLIDRQPRIVSLKPDALADIWSDIRSVADALKISDRAEKLVSELQARMSVISKAASRLSEKPRVAYIEWVDPLMAGGNWMPELVGMAGGINLFGVAGKHSPWLKWEDVVAANPDIIFVAPCGYTIARTRQDMPLLMKKPEWKALSAVKNNCVYLADGNQYFNRPGPRVVESLEILAEVLHPHAFQFGHEGKGWERYDTN
ncbi:MAG: cobalamin-binding protein [Deltaproteobacteria bacterium CG11_big_fil_rev_8_21_14_0_20_47_16]|nr:MAG: cobalamin-binding protein [Deltaproteobacteria bacterium CG11_big_fil_rev_8_21_14_0_20_47_16]